MHKNVIGLIVVIAAVLGIVAFALWSGDVEAPIDTSLTSGTPDKTTETQNSGTPSATQTTSVEPQVTSTKPIASVTVNYTDEGYMSSQFSPSTVTVEQGDSVLFVNKTSEKMWVASEPHPTHSALPGFDQKGSVGKGGVYMYTFREIGKWQYHNHLNPTRGGMIIVKQRQ